MRFHSWMFSLGTLLLLSTLLNSCDAGGGARARYTKGRYPKRDEIETLSSPPPSTSEDDMELKKISNILGDISVILDKIADRRRMVNNPAKVHTTTQSTETVVTDLAPTRNSKVESFSKEGELYKSYDDKYNEDMEKLRKELSAEITDRKDSNSIDKNKDPKPRAEIDEDNIKFKRVLTKWMQRDLAGDNLSPM